MKILLKTFKITFLFIVCGVLLSCSLPQQAGLIPMQQHGSDPLSYEQHMRLAVIYEKQGRFDPALVEFKKAAMLNPASAPAHFGIANVYLKTRRYENAERNFNKAIELDPTKGVYFNNLAWLYVETGRLTFAHNAVTRGSTLDIQNRHIYLDTLGVIETEWGNYPEAERLLIEAARFIPITDTVGMLHIYRHLHDLYTRMGKGAKAADMQEIIEGLKMGIPPAVIP